MKCSHETIKNFPYFRNMKTFENYKSSEQHPAAMKPFAPNLKKSCNKYNTK